MNKRRNRIGERFSAIEAEHDLAVLFIGPLKVLFLPPLPLVTTKVINVEGTVGLTGFVKLPLNLDQSFTGCMNSEPA